MVRFKAVVEALEKSGDCYCFYDRDGDCVEVVPRDTQDPAERRMLSEVFEDDSGRYVEIEKDPDLEREIMENFVETIDDEDLALRFDAALNRRNAESNFRVLVCEARMDKLWRSFRESKYSGEAKLLCDSADIPTE